MFLTWQSRSTSLPTATVWLRMLPTKEGSPTETSSLEAAAETMALALLAVATPGTGTRTNIVYVYDRAALPPLCSAVYPCPSILPAFHIQWILLLRSNHSLQAGRQAGQFRERAESKAIGIVRGLQTGVARQRLRNRLLNVLKLGASLKFC